MRNIIKKVVEKVSLKGIARWIKDFFKHLISFVKISNSGDFNWKSSLSYFNVFNIVRIWIIEKFELKFEPVSSDMKKMVGRKDAYLVLHIPRMSKRVGDKISIQDKRLYEESLKTYKSKFLHHFLVRLYYYFFKSSTKGFVTYGHVVTNKNMKRYLMKSGIKSLHFLPHSSNKKSVLLIAVRFDNISEEDLTHIEQNQKLGIFLVKKTFKDGLVTIDKTVRVPRKEFSRKIGENIIRRQMIKGIALGLLSVFIGGFINLFYDLFAKPQIHTLISEFVGIQPFM